MLETEEGYMRLEYFTENVAADTRRKEFDIKNHSLIYKGLKPDFLFIGDSITHYWELEAYFCGNGKLLVNRGIGGDTTTYLEKRFFVDALQLRPKYCILGIGINDSIELEGDYWKRLAPAPYDMVLERARMNISKVIQQAENSETVLILTSLLPVSIPVSLNEASRKRYICDMNGWLRKEAEKRGLLYVDYYHRMTVSGSDELTDGITYDGLHPNALGYEIMTGVIKDTFKRNNIII